MPTLFQSSSDPENLALIQAISLDIIREAAPDEELSLQKLTSSIVQAYEEGELITAETDTKTYGGFGNIDPVTLVVVPVVVAVLSELGKQLIALGVDALKKRIEEKDAHKKQATEIIEIAVEQQFEWINQKVKSKKARSKEKIIKQTIKVKIKKHFDIEP